jgi:hypothetical protein
MFTPRYHGTVFNVSYSSEPTQKAAIPGHVITSLTSCDILAGDWKSSILKFQPAEVERVEAKDIGVTVHFKAGYKVANATLVTKPVPPKKLMVALNRLTSVPKSENRFLAVLKILPTLAKTDKEQQMVLHKSIMEQAKQLIQLFHTWKDGLPVIGTMVDVYSCTFRLRFSNDAATPLDRNAKEVGLDIRRCLVSYWCRAIVRCLQPADDPLGERFFGKLAVNAANTVARIGATLGLACDDLVKVVTLFESDGIREGVEAAAVKLATEVEGVLKSSTARIPALDADDWRLVLNLCVITLSGIAVNMYQADLAILAGKIVEYTQLSVEKKKTLDNRKELLIAQGNFLRDLLCLLDGERYNEPFQYIYCLWPMKKEADAALGK